MSDMNGASFIVVGIDGSEPSKDALRWAVGQARLTGAELRAVCGWQLPSGYGWVPDFSDVDFAAEARKALEGTVAEVLGVDPGIRVLTEVRQGRPASVLIEASRGQRFLWSAAVVMAPSPGCCSARSASTAQNRPAVQC